MFDGKHPFAYIISIHAPPRGATEVVGGAIANQNISIHAPPRGATQGVCDWQRQRQISIHAPPRGATKPKRGWRWRTIFQFTPLREGRHKHLWRYLILCDISIHAPPRGATEQFPFTNFHEEISIHAPPRGATKRQFQQKLEILFQFTPLREGRRVRLACVVAGVFISIHAPPRGATR